MKNKAQLIECPTCRKTMAKTVEDCPHCGALNEVLAQKKFLLLSAYAGLAVVCLICAGPITILFLLGGC